MTKQRLTDMTHRLSLLIIAFVSIMASAGCQPGKPHAGDSLNTQINDESVVVSGGRCHELETKLRTYVADKDARIGIAVIVDGTDMVSVNGNRDFPMLSVYKFPQAIAVADYCSRHSISLNDTISVAASELRPDTWSPMRDRYGSKDIRLALSDIMAYSLQQSDNNACDILFRLIGGTHAADSLMKKLGYDGIHILNTEAEMHDDPYLCYANRATPLQMAALFDRFYRGGMCEDSQDLATVGRLVMLCGTGGNRLASPLASTGAVIGHKTGTGGINSQGRITGVNDAGYVFLSDRQGYAIAVFIADSACDMAENEKMIADISDIVFTSLMPHEPVAGEYECSDDGSTLVITGGNDGRYKMEISLFRLTDIDDGTGTLSDGCLTFSATDAAGNPISGKIIVGGDTARLVFTRSTWDYLPDGTTYIFKRK